MEIDQVYKAPSIPKLNRRNIKSTLIGGAIKPGVELKKSKFSFIKPLVKLIPDSLVPIRAEENKESLVKNIQSGAGIQKLLEQSNKILSQIKDQLSLLIRDSVKPDDKLNKSKNSFIKPLVKLIPDSLVPIKDDENRGSLVKNIQSGAGIQKLLEQSNKILTQIKEQLSLDYLSRINQEKKELAENKKKIATEKVKDKEKKIESGGRGLLGKTLDAVIAPAKSIFQKLLDFFSIILTGILVNNAFEWLKKPENQKKLQDFFNFLKEYWQELLIVFGAVKLLGLIRKIQKTANAIKSLIDFFRSNKTKLPCNCPKSPAQKGGLPDDCLPLKDCIDSLVRNPRRNGPMLEAFASLIIATSAFEPVRKLLNQKGLPVPPVPAPASASPPLQAASPVAANQAVQQNQATPSPQLAASNAIKNQNIPKNLQPIVQQLISQYYQNGFKTVSKEVGEDVITIEAINSTGAFTQRNYNPKVIFRPGLATRRRQAGQSNAAKLALSTIAAVSSLPSRGVRPSIRLPITRGAKRSTIPEPVTPSAAKPKPKPQPQATSQPRPQSTQTPESGINSIVRLRRNNPTRSQILNEKTLLIQRTQGNAADLKQIYNDKNVPLVTRIAAHQLLKEKNINLPTPTPQTPVAAQRNSKGGTIPGLAGGGTVGGPGRLGVDSVPAMIASGAKTMMGGANALLAPGEEVIRTSSAMLFRPLLKDINDNAGRLWQAFTNAVRKQNLNETIVTDLIDQFGKIIEEFKDLLDKEATDIKRKNRSGGATGGGILRPSFGRSNVIEKIDKGVGGIVQDVGGMIGRNRGRQTGLPGGGFIGEQLGRREANNRYQDFTNSIRSLLDRSRSNITAPNINIQNPVNLTQNVVNPQIEKTILGDKNVYVIPVPISRESSKLSSSRSSGGNISVINLPPKVVNLTKPSQPKSLPSSPSGTSVPSISPIDESNDYVFTTPTMYGILV